MSNPRTIKIEDRQYIPSEPNKVVRAEVTYYNRRGYFLRCDPVELKEYGGFTGFTMSLSGMSSTKIVLIEESKRFSYPKLKKLTDGITKTAIYEEAMNEAIEKENVAV